MGVILDNHSKCNNKTAESNYMYLQQNTSQVFLQAKCNYFKA